MRQGMLPLVLVLSFASPLLQAQEVSSEGLPEQRAELDDHQDQSLQQPKAPQENAVLGANTAGQAHLARLRQENQRLRLQLEQLRSEAPVQPQPQLLNDQQQWFAVGGGVGVLGYLLGVLTTRGRRRRQWLN